MLHSRRIRRMQDIVDWRLCVGCGMCYAVCDRDAVTLRDVPSEGIRPVFEEPACSECNSCLQVCPGNIIDARSEVASDPLIGPALHIVEGYAADPEIRHRASSGGLISAISLYCLEHEGIAGVLHTGTDEDSPCATKPAISRDRAGILARSGSRYQPASPCAGLRHIGASDGPLVFVGKPCDVSAVNTARREDPALGERIGLTLSLFCAGAPSTDGTISLLDELGVDRSDVRALRYRGCGWPGSLSVHHGEDRVEACMSYQESWERLSKFRSFRCLCCPDGLGSTADISCGDAWHRAVDCGPDDPGRSVAIARTPRGREIMVRAAEAGYIEVTPIDAEDIIAGQRYLVRKRQELFGRLLALKFFAIPFTTFPGHGLVESWSMLPLRRRLKSVLSTAHRIVRRRLCRPQLNKT